MNVDQQRIEKLIRILGYFEDDSFSSLNISGDDATRTWHLKSSDGTWSFGSSLREAIDNFEE